MDSISVLVVEDNAAIQNLLARFLTSEGWNVFVAGTAQEARQLAQRSEIDLALIDINLPDEDGYSLSRHLRSTYRPTSSPVSTVAQTIIWSNPSIWIFSAHEFGLWQGESDPR